MAEKKKEEYELVPISPLRRLEKEIEKLKAEKVGLTSETALKDIIDMLKINQELVERVLESSDAVADKIASLTERLEKLITSVKELVDILKEAGKEEVPVEKGEDIEKRFEEFLAQNREILSRLESLEKKIKRSEAERSARKAYRYPSW